MFNLDQQLDQETEQLFSIAQHTLDAATALDVDTGGIFGLSADMSAEQLQSVADTLADAIETAAVKDAPNELGICPVTGRKCHCGKLATR